MIDPQYIRENTEQVKMALQNRQFPLESFNEFIKLDQEWRSYLQNLDELKNQRNQLTPKGKPSPEQLKSLKELSETIKEKQEMLQEL